MSTSQPLSPKLEQMPLAARPPSPPFAVKHRVRFSLILIALFIAFFVVCLEGTVVATALPTIANDLTISQFVWIGSTYAVASAAVLPLCGGLSQAFGRRPVILGCLLVFMIGGAIGGAAPNQTALLIGRTLQGMGGGGTMALCTIILSDLVPLSERGKYNGILGFAWCISGGIGPVVGGALAQQGQWRWLFYLNIPVSAVSAALIIFTLELPTPLGSMSEKFKKVDWGGNAIVVASTVSCSIALTWGGIQFPWSSATVLVPLILGFIGLIGFFVYEGFVPAYPLIPFNIMSNRTSVSGFIQTFVLSTIFPSLLYYLPVYYQACKDATPTASGVDLFGFAFSTAPITIITGISIAAIKRYRPQLWSGWAILIMASGLLTTITENTSRGTSIGFQILNGLGVGLLYMNLYFPILAPLPITATAHALSLYNYSRAIAQTWGVTIGASVLQNGLQGRLSSDFLSRFPSGVQIAYAIIPEIRGLDEPLKGQVRAAFASSLRNLWFVHVGLAGCGFLVSLMMKGLPLHTQIDRDWELKEREKSAQTSSN